MFHSQQQEEKNLKLIQNLGKEKQPPNGKDEYEEKEKPIMICVPNDVESGLNVKNKQSFKVSTRKLVCS